MKQYNILKYPWHTPHDYELAKLPHQFFYLNNTPRCWATNQRPVPDTVNWVSHHDERATDVMILHVDQWTHNEISKRQLFLRFKHEYTGPKIVINHGCNMVDGCSSEIMQELLKDCHVVCNSSTAHELWGLQNSRFIRHGMMPEEWPSTDYSHHNVVVTQHYGGTHAAFRNVAQVNEAEKEISITWVGRDKKFDSFNKYRNFLQSSSIFLQPSYASPNPRSRTEAMLTGLAIVTTNSHGEDEYITNGVNGFCSNDFEELIDFIKYLHLNPTEVRKIGQAGRATAQEVFHIDNFTHQWDTLLQEVLG